MRAREGDQPLPIRHDGSDVQSLVVKDLMLRRELGVSRYGTALQPHNGRDGLRDLYEELLDAACYARQVMEERTYPELVWREDFGVELVRAAAEDSDVVRAARVSTRGAEPSDSSDEADAGLIGYLMRHRHGTPFEHSVFTFRVSAPIFVAREAHRHRMASVNEESGRYRVLAPVFYLPPADRPLVQVGKAGEYRYEPGTPELAETVRSVLTTGYAAAYVGYRRLLEEGVAREVARMVLPVATYTTWYLSINVRSLMNLLSLRVASPDSTYPSSPMQEIQRVAERMEEHFQTAMPLTHQAFVAAGRVAP